ncbi:MAG: hypothetical protein ACJ8GL_06660 [Bacillus sp. (in: firmicutes)]|jgi:hypothetical protein
MEGIHEILSALYSSAEGSAEIAVSLVAALIQKKRSTLREKLVYS